MDLIARRKEFDVTGTRMPYASMACDAQFLQLIWFVTPMNTKDLSTAERVSPRFIEPMYAEAVRELPDGGLWTYEAKFDGYRCLAAKRSGAVVLWSRRGNGFTGRFPEIARACEKLPPDTLIDGEVVAIDADGRPSFNALQHSRSNAYLQFYAFDVLVHRGRDVMGFALEARRELLEDALQKVAYPVLHCVPFNAKPADLIRAAKELELEGVIAKRKGSRYESGRRSIAWLKLQLKRSQEFVIGGYTLGNPFDALIVGCYEGRELRYVSKVRNGFTPRLRRDLYPLLRMLEVGRCPFVNLPEAKRGRWDYGLTNEEMQNCRWLKPRLVGQIEFTEWTPDDHLRHSSFTGLRDDKDPLKIVRE
jgi:DNA ligase D-like protein (predicted ligase)